jgi:hypothetical protein
MTNQIVILNDRTRVGDETGAGLMRNRCAFTSKDMGAEWDAAFTYAIVFGWHDDDPEDDATAEVAEKFGWDETLIAFLRDAHERFKQLPDKATS